jgi:transcription elongation factor
MSFLLDQPLIYAAGRAYGSAAPESAQRGRAVAAGAATTAVFVGTSVALWLHHPATKPLWKALGFATYPLAWWLGWDRGRRSR